MSIRHLWGAHGSWGWTQWAEGGGEGEGAHIWRRLEHLGTHGGDEVVRSSQTPGLLPPQAQPLVQGPASVVDLRDSSYEAQLPDV